MKIRFKDIPRGIPCKIRGFDAIRGTGNNAKVRLFPNSSKKWETIFVRDKEVCEVDDTTADLNRLGQFGIPPRPDAPPAVVRVTRLNKAIVDEARRVANLKHLRALTSPAHSLVGSPSPERADDEGAT